MGYATLDAYANTSLGFRSNADSQAKQLFIAKQVKAAAPDLPVWAGTAWDITLCGPSMPFEPFHSCMMEVDEQMRASCGYDDATGSYSAAASPDCKLLTCNGTVVKRADNHTIHGFEKPATRSAWAQVFRDWQSSGAIDGVIWDGMQHGGGPDQTCSRAEAAAFTSGQFAVINQSRAAIGQANVALCTNLLNTVVRKVRKQQMRHEMLDRLVALDQYIIEVALPPRL